MAERTRLNDVWMTKGDGTWADGVQTNVSGLIFGGNFGYSKDYGGWINNTPYTSSPLLSFLLQAPLGFKLLPNSQIYISTLRSLVETIRHEITGLNHRLDVQVDESQPFGKSGQKFQVPTNVTEQQLNVTFSYYERLGLSIMRFHEFWIRMFIMHEESKYADINTVAGTEAFDCLPDMYSMSVIFILPDRKHDKVVQSWLGFNMWPKSTGDNEASFNVDNPSEVKVAQIEYTGTYIYNYGVDQFAQSILDNINIINAQISKEQLPENLSFIDGMVADGPASYSNTVNNIANRQVSIG